LSTTEASVQDWDALVSDEDKAANLKWLEGLEWAVMPVHELPASFSERLHFSISDDQGIVIKFRIAGKRNGRFHRGCWLYFEDPHSKVPRTSDEIKGMEQSRFVTTLRELDAEMKSSHKFPSGKDCVVISDHFYRMMNPVTRSDTEAEEGEKDTVKIQLKIYEERMDFIITDQNARSSHERIAGWHFGQINRELSYLELPYASYTHVSQSSLTGGSPSKGS